MDITSISGIRGDGLEDPRRTGSIASIRFDVAGISRTPAQRGGQQQHSNQSQLPYEDAEFVEIVDESEPEQAPAELPSGTHFRAIA